MKICLLSDDYPAKGRMSYIFVQQLVDALVDRGITIDVIAPQSISNSLIRGKALLPFVTTYKTKKNNEYRVFRPKFLSAGSLKFLKSLISTSKRQAIRNALKKINVNTIDVFYAHFWHNAVSLAEITHQLNAPLFVACGEGGFGLKDLVSSMTLAEINNLRDRITGVISVSSENERQCIQYGLCRSDNIIVLPNCVDQEIFHKGDYQGSRKKLGIAESDFVVAFVGGFTHRKGSARLSQALKELNDEDIKAFFIGKSLGGESDIPAYCNTIFQGPISHDKIPEYLCASDVFVLPTLKEGCCNAIVEALSCGIPVISSNGPFNDDILDNKCSIRIDPTSVSEIKKAIIKLKDDVKLREDMRLGALEKSNNWSIVSRAEKVHNFIKYMTQNRKIK